MMATDKLAQYERLASMVPVVNEKAKKQLDAGAAIALQSNLAAAPAAAPVNRVAQAVAPAAAAQVGQNANATAAQTQQQVGQIAGQALQTQAASQKADLARRGLGQAESLNSARLAQGAELARAEIKTNKEITQDEIASAKRVSEVGLYQDNRLLNVSLRQRQELAALGSDVKAKILDAQLQFEEDEAGRLFSNERQLADYAATNAKTEQDFSARMQDLKQASDDKVSLLTHSHQQITAALNRGFLTANQKLDHETNRYLTELKRKIEEEIEREKADAANKQMMYQGVGTIVGAGVGAAFGGPGGYAAGAVVGASVGGAVGTMAYGAGV